MQSKKDNFSGFNMFEDLTKMASGTVGTLFDAKKEVEGMFKQNVEQVLGMYNLVTREEYEVVKEMVSKSRQQQGQLEKRVAELEAKLLAANSKLASSAAKESAKASSAERAVAKLPVSKQTAYKPKVASKTVAKKAAPKKAVVSKTVVKKKIAPKSTKK